MKMASIPGEPSEQLERSFDDHPKGDVYRNQAAAAARARKSFTGHRGAAGNAVAMPLAAPLGELPTTSPRICASS
jgi:hypothetical protein